MWVRGGKVCYLLGGVQSQRASAAAALQVSHWIATIPYHLITCYGYLPSGIVEPLNQFTLSIGAWGGVSIPSCLAGLAVNTSLRYSTSYKKLMFYDHCTGTDTDTALRCPYCSTKVEARWWYWLARQFKTSVDSGIDVNRTEKWKLYSRVLQNKWDSSETAMGVRDCDYGRTMGTGMGVLWVQIRAYVHVNIDINIFMKCTICLYHVCNAYI